MPNHPDAIELTACDHLAVCRVTGADARSFLQSQLTQDVERVSASSAALAGFCTAQGRLWASMVLVQGQGEQEVLAVMRADLLESFLKRIRMFVLRSKVSFEVLDQWHVFGVHAHRAGGELTVAGQPVQDAWATVSDQGNHWIRLPSAEPDLVRLLVLSPDDPKPVIEAALGAQTSLMADTVAWQAADMAAGLGWIQAKTQDLFIAQTLNLDLVGGVSFTKGCFPGQEVVARAHYRGTVKRRMHLAHVQNPGTPIEPAMDVFVADDPDSPVGRLIDVTQAGDRATVLFEAPFKAIQTSTLCVGSANGPALQLDKLPYTLEPA